MLLRIGEEAPLSASRPAAVADHGNAVLRDHDREESTTFSLSNDRKAVL
jgi:hypothetical protein